MFLQTMTELTGKQLHTTFWSDFSIAEQFGPDAIRDTFERCQEWLSDVDYWKELVLVLNWKIWQLYETNPDMAQLYEKLWVQADRKAFKTFKGAELSSYISYLD